MARFVDHEIREIGEEKAGGVAEGVEEEERIGEERGDAGVAGDGVPRLRFGERERHGDRVATAGIELRGRRGGVARGEPSQWKWEEDAGLRSFTHLR